jgi:hypothetical protein
MEVVMKSSVKSLKESK